jgi:hypothetical protein
MRGFCLGLFLGMATAYNDAGGEWQGPARLALIIALAIMFIGALRDAR